MRLLLVLSCVCFRSWRGHRPAWVQVWGTLRGGRCLGGRGAQLRPRRPAGTRPGAPSPWGRRCLCLLYSEQLYDFNRPSSELGSWTAMSASCHWPGQHTGHTSVWEAAQDVFPPAELRRPRHSAGAQYTCDVSEFDRVLLEKVALRPAPRLQFCGDNSSALRATY